MLTPSDLDTRTDLNSFRLTSNLFARISIPDEVRREHSHRFRGHKEGAAELIVTKPLSESR
jgi:hypothetical protein